MCQATNTMVKQSSSAASVNDTFSGASESSNKCDDNVSSNVSDYSDSQ